MLIDLNGLVLSQWDEARLGVNALEMVQSRNWLVTTYAFQPDLWNTKPPLMIWLQAGLISLLGPTGWAVRLPAALAMLTTITLLCLFITRFLGRPVSALVAGSVLVSTLGFVGEHHGKTGDYDALLTLAQLVAGLSVVLLLETGRSRWWVGVGAGLVVATLTKGVAVLLPWPGVIMYCLARRRGRNLLRMPGFWLVLLAWVSVAVAWYVLREQASPGYWAAINANELGGRFGSALENHQEVWYYYLQRLGTTKFIPWIYLVPLVVPFALRHPNAQVRRVAWFALSWAAGLLLVLTVAKTKIEWYIAPAYPWVALLLGLGGPRLAARLLARIPAGSGRLSFRVLLVLLVLAPPFIMMWRQLRSNRRDTLDYIRVGYGVRALQNEADPPSPLAVVAEAGFYESRQPLDVYNGGPGYNASLRFYVLAYPRAIRVVPPTAVAALPSSWQVLTGSAADSALVRAAFPEARCRAVGRFPCWLWTRPAAK
ncbi:glycosyltransferase family 39 protein [Hymenobacter sp. NST-14]|uniref:ArnT family glycosyltransferase n=1 Tax=Hymenobacter piscis TaxID=2839984 RepID=UPI001C0382BA|nr:glycosyltransferase family 39 protein [Hymenobacter piscis]MBT9393349.1 glycosyltransferase family 39 protein [Hymenobacter piscis]